jgi:hypothetical protein
MEKKKESRKFNGPLNPRDEKVHHTTDLTMKEYCNLQKKHLKEYLKGNTEFKYKGVVYKVESEIIKDVKK